MKRAVSPPTTEQEEPEDGRRDAPGARLLPLLEQLAEDGHERGRERGVRDERADEVRDLEGDREGVDRAARAEVVRGDDLADEPEHPREPGRGREDRRRPREPPSLGSLVHAASIGTAVSRDPAALPALLRSCAPAECGPFFEMPNIQQQKKRVRIAERQRDENLRYRSTVKTLTKRLEAAVADGRQGQARRRAPRARADDRQGRVPRGAAQEHGRAQEGPRRPPRRRAP